VDELDIVQEMNPDYNVLTTRRVLAIIGCLLLTWPLNVVLGIWLNIAKMVKNFSESSHHDPSELAINFSSIILTLFYSFIMGIIGAAIVSIVVSRKINREKWLYTCVMTLSVIWCILYFPFGVIVGVHLFTIFRRHKSQFFPIIKNPEEQAEVSNGR
jgi:Na+/proline symporter